MKLKHVFLAYLAMFIVALSGLWFVQAQVSPLPNNRQEITEKAYSNWLSKIDESDKESKLITLKARVDIAREKTYQQRAKELLLYITLLTDDSLDQLWSDEASSPQSLDEESSELSNEWGNGQILDNYQNLIAWYEAWVRVYQWGDKGALISRYQFIAQREAFWVNEILITASRSLDTVVSSITLFDENGVILGSGTPSGWDVTIQIAEYLLEQGQTDFYIIADFLPMGYNNAWEGITDFVINVKITEARGYFSDDEITSPTKSWDMIIVTPVKIIDYGFINEGYWYTVEPYISDNSNETFGIITFTAWENDNRQIDNAKEAEISLDSLTVTVATNLQWVEKQELLESLRFERIDVVRGAIDGTISGNTVTFLPSAFSESFARIEQGEEAAWRIRWVFPGVLGSDTYIQLSIQDLTGGWVIYSEVSSPQQVSVLDWWTYQITADRVREL